MSKYVLNAVVFLWLTGLTFLAFSENLTTKVNELEANIVNLQNNQSKIIDNINELKLELAQASIRNKALLEDRYKNSDAASENSNTRKTQIIERSVQTETKDNSDKESSGKIESEQNLLAFAEKMMGDDDYQPTDKISQQFEEQGVDFFWASTYENNITELFSSSPELASLPLKNVSCRSSICEVSIFSQGQDSFGLANSIAKSLADKDWRDPAASFIFDSEEKDGVIKFYLGKDEDSLKF